MLDDEETPKSKGIQPMDLDVMGIEQLEDYISELEMEIQRVKAKIDDKQGARASAESFFKS